MKKLKKIESINILSISQMKSIFAGVTQLTHVWAEATADCGGFKVTCKGDYGCTATDNEGCSCEDGKVKKSCVVA